MKDLNNIHFLTSGCSFSADEYSWPSLLPKYRNLSEHGAGNTYIRRQLQKELLLNPDIYDFVIVQWSTIDRWDYPFTIKSNKDTHIIEMNVRDHNIDISNSVSYFRMGTNYNHKSKHFYDNYYSIYGQFLNTLEDIYFTQLFLESIGKPYLMFSIANYMTTDISFEMIKNIHDIDGDLIRQRTGSLKLEKVFDTFESADSLSEIKNKINWDKFIWTSDFKIDVFGDGFTEFLINKNQIFGAFNNTHPDENQHKLLFEEKILPRIEDLIQI